MEEHNKLFIDVFDYVKNNDIEYESLKKVITRLNFQNRTRDYIDRYRTENNPDYRFHTNIIMNDDLTDLRYLFKYGSYSTNQNYNVSKSSR
ncbi:MAG: hypothetical protein ACTSSK_18610 [Candidatus Heimdallarchaeota archaeon]